MILPGAPNYFGFLRVCYITLKVLFVVHTDAPLFRSNINQSPMSQTDVLITISEKNQKNAR